jgi:hypothetical protein
VKKCLIIERKNGGYIEVPFSGNVKVTTDPITDNLEFVIDMNDKELQVMRKKLGRGNVPMEQ